MHEPILLLLWMLAYHSLYGDAMNLFLRSEELEDTPGQKTQGKGANHDKGWSTVKDIQLVKEDINLDIFLV